MAGYGDHSVGSQFAGNIDGNRVAQTPVDQKASGEADRGEDTRKGNRGPQGFAQQAPSYDQHFSGFNVGGDDGGSYVWKVDAAAMTVSLAPVTAGQLSGSEIDILEGIATGDRIAVSGVQHLADGMKISELTD